MLHIGVLMTRKPLFLTKLGRPYYGTTLGHAYVGDSLELMKMIPDESVNLVITSPPFALRRKKQYGNVSHEKYIEWFMPFARQIRRVLRKDGSFVLDIGGAWNKGEPTRSLYHFKLVLALCEEANLFKLAQEFYWFNPAKLPGPAEWVNIRRIRVKDAVNPVWWLSKVAHPKASNRRVLAPYTQSMLKLLKDGYNAGSRPSEHYISKKWGTNNGGAIPPNLLNISNLLAASNTRSFDSYLESCRKLGVKVHPARFVEYVPEFFVKFLTTPGDVVLDPFSGSNVVGAIAEKLRRRWLSFDLSEEYTRGSFFRLEHAIPFDPSLKRFLRERRAMKSSIYVRSE
jgi:site-specific DNA-methyltransferase (cytosine-N4-specific)